MGFFETTTGLLVAIAVELLVIAVFVIFLFIVEIIRLARYPKVEEEPSVPSLKRAGREYSPSRPDR